MKNKIAITSLASISPLGNNIDSIWKEYLSPKTRIIQKECNGINQFMAEIPADIKTELEQLRQSEIKYKALDETVLMAILTSRQAIKQANWKMGDDFGINIGSSRGATHLFEKYRLGKYLHKRRSRGKKLSLSLSLSL